MKSCSCKRALRIGWLLIASIPFWNAEHAVWRVESFVGSSDGGLSPTWARSRSRSRTRTRTRTRTLTFTPTPTLTPTRTPSSLFQQRQAARRWNGNYKHASKKLADVPKSKKMMLNLTAHGVTKTLEKKRMETLQHVLTKAMIWKLFATDYPDLELEIELDIGDPDYLPDVVGLRGAESAESAESPGIVCGTTTTATATATDNNARVVFWGESGRMKPRKALDLMRRYPTAHIVHCRWGIGVESFMAPFVEHLEAHLLSNAGEGDDRTDRTEENDGVPNTPGATTWWKGRFTFGALPLRVWEFIDEDTGTIFIEKSDLEWRELDLSRLDFGTRSSSTSSTNSSRGVDA